VELHLQGPYIYGIFLCTGVTVPFCQEVFAVWGNTEVRMVQHYSSVSKDHTSIVLCRFCLCDIPEKDFNIPNVCSLESQNVRPFIGNGFHISAYMMPPGSK
jgi:hypothetical protein